MKSTKRIALLLALVFLLPALFYSVYEISSLSKDEKMIQEIYNKQLEAILFSVNQYSDDILNSWISKVEIGTENASEKHSLPPRATDLLTYNSSLALIFISDTVGGAPIRKDFSLNDSIVYRLQGKIDTALTQGKPHIQQLIS